MAPYNYFNYFWCSHIVYGLAYLREGDPESLVAYRYFWGISPEDAGVPLRNKFVADDQWKSGDNERMTALYSPENYDILKQGTANPNLGETLRKLSAFSAGRAGKGGVGASMVSFFSVGMPTWVVLTLRCVALVISMWLLMSSGGLQTQRMWSSVSSPL